MAAVMPIVSPSPEPTQGPPSEALLEEVLQTPGLELDNGELLEKPMSRASNRIGTRIAAMLFGETTDSEIVEIFTHDQGFSCFDREQPKQVIKKPDVAVVRKDRLPAEDVGYIDVAPDLAVEVVSPGDIGADLDRKTVAYLEAGVPEVWIVYPDTQRVLVHRRDRIELYTPGRTIALPDLLPGFSRDVADFFK